MQKMSDERGSGSGAVNTNGRSGQNSFWLLKGVMFPLIFSLSCWRANSQTNSSHSDLPVVQVKCQPHHSPDKNEIKPSYSFHRLQPKAPEQLSRKKKDGRGEEDFSSFKVRGIFHCYPFCHLIRRTKGFPLFQSSICIYNNVLPWQNLIIPDLLGGITSLQECKEGKAPPRPGALGCSRGMAQVLRAQDMPGAQVGLGHPRGHRGCHTEPRELQELPLSPAHAVKCGTEGGAPPACWAHSGAASAQIL